MDMMTNDDQDTIAATVASFLADRMPVVGRGRDHVTEGPEIDPLVWRECAELGWLSLGIAEADGGVGYGLVEEMMLFRELGRSVAPGPFLPGVLAAHLAVAAGDRELATAIISGERRVALGTPIGVASISLTVSAELSVVHIDGADLVVVCDADGAALVPVSGCDIAAIDSIDGSVTVGRGRAAEVPAIAFAPATQAAIFQRGLVLAAAAAVGIAEAALAVAVAYAGVRVQFGKPIGVNQAIKHWCADMAVQADGAFAQACYAAVAVQDALAGAATEAAVAKYFADDAARRNGEGSVQIHGAIGFTSEATPYRFVLRAQLLSQCLAGRAALLDTVVGR